MKSINTDEFCSDLNETKMSNMMFSVAHKIQTLQSETYDIINANMCTPHCPCSAVNTTAWTALSEETIAANYTIRVNIPFIFDP